MHGGVTLGYGAAILGIVHLLDSLLPPHALPGLAVTVVALAAFSGAAVLLARHDRELVRKTFAFTVLGGIVYGMALVMVWLAKSQVIVPTLGAMVAVPLLHGMLAAVGLDVLELVRVWVFGGTPTRIPPMARWCVLALGVGVTSALVYMTLVLRGVGLYSS